MAKKEYSTDNKIDLNVLEEGDLDSVGVLKVNLNDVFIDRSNNSRNIESDAYEEEKIGQLVTQIKTLGGLLNPIIISPLRVSTKTDNKAWILVGGYRRVTALERVAQETEEAKWIREVPARIANVKNHTAFKIAQLVENLRVDLNPVETAKSLQVIIDESGDKITNAQLSEATGIPASTVSRYLRLLDLPEAVQDMISQEKLPVTSAFFLMSSEYEIDESDLTKIAKLGCKYQVAEFRELLDRNYKKSTNGSEARAEQKPEKPKKMMKSTEIDKYVINFLKKRINENAEKEDAKKPKFSQLELDKRIIDAVNTLFNEKTVLAEEIEPFKQEIISKEEKAKQSEQGTKNYQKFIKAQSREVRRLLNLPVDENGERPYPSIVKAVSKVISNLKGLKESDIEKLGFDFEPAKMEEYAKEIVAEFQRARKEAVKRTAAKKAKEKEEAAAKKEEVAA
jgi:ParB/RepB/Spo0J family partition protein